MARINVTVTPIELPPTPGERADEPKLPAMLLACGRCGHEVVVLGTEPLSVRYGLHRMRVECPRDEHHYYQIGPDHVVGNT
jgi:hypothetical protein